MFAGSRAANPSATFRTRPPLTDGNGIAGPPPGSLENTTHESGTDAFAHETIRKEIALGGRWSTRSPVKREGESRFLGADREFDKAESSGDIQDARDFIGKWAED